MIIFSKYSFLTPKSLNFVPAFERVSYLTHLKDISTQGSIQKSGVVGGLK
jgi:hypothetical protein